MSRLSVLPFDRVRDLNAVSRIRRDAFLMLNAVCGVRIWGSKPAPTVESRRGVREVLWGWEKRVQRAGSYAYTHLPSPTILTRLFFSIGLSWLGRRKGLVTTTIRMSCTLKSPRNATPNVRARRALTLGGNPAVFTTSCDPPT